MSKTRPVLICSAVAVVILIPLVAAGFSPLLAWRTPIYIAAGFAGIAAMSLLLLQPLLAMRALPGLTPIRSRRCHQVIGIALVFAVVVHVAGLWITSPPDVIDALLFASPTPFSLWGVIAMWAVFASATLMGLRHRLRLRTWRLSHRALALLIVAGSVLHAMLIEGTMELISKTALCALVVVATIYAVCKKT